MLQNRIEPARQEDNICADIELGGLRPPSPAFLPDESATASVSVNEEELTVSPCLTFPSKELQGKYTDFLMKETSTFIPILLIVLTYFIYVSHTVVQVLHPSRVHATLSIARHGRTATLLPVLAYAYCICASRHPRLPKPRLNVTWIGNIIISSHSILSGLIILSRTLIGSCDSNPLGCNPGAPYNSIPLDAFMFCAYSMIALPVLVKCHSWIVIFASNICISIMIMASLAHVRADADTFASALLFCFAILVTLYDYERYSINSFIGLEKLRIAVEGKTIAEIEAQVISKHSEELRFLIGNVAHDLKTPLQAMVSEIDVLEEQRGRASAADIASSTSAMRATSHFMTMMINRSLDYMKSTSGLVLVPRMETVSLADSFSWVVDCIGHRQSGVPISIHPVPPDIIDAVITDKQWLLENMLCLTSNAVKFVSRGSIDICVRLMTRAEAMTGGFSDSNSGGKLKKNGSPGSFMVFDAPRAHRKVAPDMPHNMICISVEDTGIGIDPADMQQLFRPFKQAQRSAGGTGLGLFALSKRVESLGGACGVRGRLDGARGCLFWFCIPYKPDSTVANSSVRSTVSNASGPLDGQGSGNSASSVTVASPPADGSGDGASGQKPLVLVVDDSLLIQKATTRSLQKDGYVVRCAGNGAECLEAMETATFAFILLDINMPVMDGYETIKRIRRAEAERGDGARRQLVIGISANSDSETSAEAIRLGMDAFLEKPLKAAAFKECLQRVGFLSSDAISIGNASM